MRKTDLESYRSRLLGKRSELFERIRAARNAETQGGDKGAPDLGDRALSTVLREMAYHLSGSEQKVLRQIDDALSRVEEGSYGSCSNCGKAIQKARLGAVPWAIHCIGCQELKDMGEI
jgi:DnaK suppressor protein